MFSNKDLRKLIIPLVIEQLLAVTIGMADTVMVSSCGEAAVSGISLVDSINFLLITLFSSLATGGAVIASQYIGRGDHKSASLAAKQLFYASLALSAVLGIIAVFFRKPVLNMVFGSIEADVMAHAQIYFCFPRSPIRSLRSITPVRRCSALWAIRARRCSFPF